MSKDQLSEIGAEDLQSPRPGLRGVVPLVLFALGITFTTACTGEALKEKLYLGCRGIITRSQMQEALKQSGFTGQIGNDKLAREAYEEKYCR